MLSLKASKLVFDGFSLELERKLPYASPFAARGRAVYIDTEPTADDEIAGDAPEFPYSSYND